MIYYFEKYNEFYSYEQEHNNLNFTGQYQKNSGNWLLKDNLANTKWEIWQRTSQLLTVLCEFDLSWLCDFHGPTILS